MTALPFTTFVVIAGIVLGLVSHAIYSNSPVGVLWASLLRWTRFGCPRCPGRLSCGVWTLFCDRCDYCWPHCPGVALAVDAFFIGKERVQVRQEFQAFIVKE